MAASSDVRVSLRSSAPGGVSDGQEAAVVSTTEAIPDAPHDVPRLRLLGGFVLEIAAAPVPLPLQAQRVLAYICLNMPIRAMYDRGMLAERLWAGSSVRRSHASLRTALWRIRQTDTRLIRTAAGTVQLGDQVRVDLHEGQAWADRLLAPADLSFADADLTGLAGDLLPGWEEDWLLMERERVRQLRVHALDALAHRLLVVGRHAQAIAAALAAVDVEPLRESAQATLIDIYLAERNTSEAVRQYDRYANLLWQELGLPPSPDLAARFRHRRIMARGRGGNAGRAGRAN
jgi:DNA-binding SARP family transcriptional activator